MYRIPMNFRMEKTEHSVFKNFEYMKLTFCIFLKRMHSTFQITLKGHITLHQNTLLTKAILETLVPRHTPPIMTQTSRRLTKTIYRSDRL